MIDSIRPARPADRGAVYEICLRTADAGQDGSHLYTDPELPGHIWAGPYLALEPAHAFVVTDADDRAVGYVLAACDSRAFEARLEREWWPDLRRRYPLDGSREALGDRLAVHLVHHPPVADDALVATYPSHLHIDLLPAAQGRGLGRRLVERLCTSLRDAGSPGVHLGVSTRNVRAIGFYCALGFDELLSDEHHLVFGMRLD